MSFQSNNRKVICKIDGVDDVDAAKCFVGKEIFVKNTELPKLKKGQYYYNDLVGMSVLLKNNSIGVIKENQNHGAGDYAIIQTKKEEMLVPIIKEHVLKIDINKKTFRINPQYYEF